MGPLEENNVKIFDEVAEQFKDDDSKEFIKKTAKNIKEDQVLAFIDGESKPVLNISGAFMKSIICDRIKNIG